LPGNYRFFNGLPAFGSMGIITRIRIQERRYEIRLKCPVDGLVFGWVFCLLYKRFAAQRQGRIEPTENGQASVGSRSRIHVLSMGDPVPIN